MTLTGFDKIGEKGIVHPSAQIAFGGIRGCKIWHGTVEIGDNVFIGANAVISRGAEGLTKIGNNVMIMNLANIGHNVTIGDNVEIGAGVIICGHAVIKDNVKIKSGAIIRNRAVIGENTVIGMGAAVVKDCLPNCIYIGVPAERTYERELKHD